MGAHRRQGPFRWAIGAPRNQGEGPFRWAMGVPPQPGGPFRWAVGVSRDQGEGPFRWAMRAPRNQGEGAFRWAMGAPRRQRAFCWAKREHRRQGDLSLGDEGPPRPRGRGLSPLPLLSLYAGPRSKSGLDKPSQPRLHWFHTHGGRQSAAAFRRFFPCAIAFGPSLRFFSVFA